MEIELTCRESPKHKINVKVCALTFAPDGKTFTMPLCVGDDWHQTIKCPVATAPRFLHFQWDKVFIDYDRLQDAKEFGAWLEEAEARAQEGYRTMRD